MEQQAIATFNRAGMASGFRHGPGVVEIDFGMDHSSVGVRP